MQLPRFPKALPLYEQRRFRYRPSDKLFTVRISEKRGVYVLNFRDVPGGFGSRALRLAKLMGLQQSQSGAVFVSAETAERYIELYAVDFDRVLAKQ